MDMDYYKYKSLILLDWDDTLFPTSWIIKNNVNLNDTQTRNEYVKKFHKLDSIASRLLTNLSTMGQVVLITNASAKWILTSSSVLFLTQQVLRKSVYIVSARDAYQPMYPDDIDMWKRKSFNVVINDYFKQHKFQNIISAGDAEYEFYALTDLYDTSAVARNKLFKTIKFMKEPGYYDIVDQLEVFNKCHKKIILNNNHLDLNFSVVAP